MPTSSRRILLGAALAIPFIGAARSAEALQEVRLDYATYIPLSALIKDQHRLEAAWCIDRVVVLRRRVT